MRPIPIYENGLKPKPILTLIKPFQDGGSKKEKEKERLKVCKPPPETKRPPRLMQTPCAFVQTSTFYTNPLAEVSG